MKTPLAALLLFAASLAAVPSASAQASASAAGCVEVYDFPDDGLWVCVQPDDPDCWILLVRNTFIGPVETCLVPAPAAVHSIDPPFPACEPVGTYLTACVDPRGDCLASIAEQRLIPYAGPICLVPAVGAAATVECMPVHQRINVGAVSVVRRDSCSPPEVYQCPYEGAPIGSCTNVLELEAAAASPPSPPLPEPGERVCWRSGQGELQSVWCVDPSSADCALYHQQVTGVGSQWWCYPSGEHGSDF